MEPLTPYQKRLNRRRRGWPYWWSDRYNIVRHPDAATQWVDIGQGSTILELMALLNKTPMQAKHSPKSVAQSYLRRCAAEWMVVNPLAGYGKAATNLKINPARRSITIYDYMRIATCHIPLAADGPLSKEEIRMIEGVEAYEASRLKNLELHEAKERCPRRHFSAADQDELAAARRPPPSVATSTAMAMTTIMKALNEVGILQPTDLLDLVGRFGKNIDSQTDVVKALSRLEALGLLFMANGLVALTPAGGEVVHGKVRMATIDPSYKLVMDRAAKQAQRRRERKEKKRLTALEQGSTVPDMEKETNNMTLEEGK